jgi:hypothetical protein
MPDSERNKFFFSYRESRLKKKKDMKAEGRLIGKRIGKEGK